MMEKEQTHEDSSSSANKISHNHHDDFLYNKPPKAFHEYIQISKNLSELQEEGSSNMTRSVIIYGFPFDEGTAINNGRVGGERAPFSFRSGLKDIKIPPFEDIHKIKIFDCGNVRESLFDTFTLDEAHELLTKRVKEFFEIAPESVPFIIGGSNDQSYQNALGLMRSFPEKSIAAINIDAHFDVRPLKDGKKHSGSPFRSLIEDGLFKKNKSKLIEFANQGCQCSKEHYDFIKNNGGAVYWLDKDIRRYKKVNFNIIKYLFSSKEVKKKTFL